MSESVAIDFEINVFINCPFDEAYHRLLRPLLFTILFVGFNPRIASERFDSGENRIDKISTLIQASKYSVHDLSRLKASHVNEFFRMNMPFELGIDYGCRLFGIAPMNRKKCLIMEKERFDFMKALSDLSGVDIKSHANEPGQVVRVIRNWFVEAAGVRGVQGPRVIWNMFQDFTSTFYKARAAEGFSDEDLDMMPLPEYVDYIRIWLAENQEERPPVTMVPKTARSAGTRPGHHV